ncbi:MAG TPA: PKD domain-containing protein [Chryseosolibacter sp.]|nr:PKD domain-containing protein [Chryseosolibacter sp.]
MRNIIKTCLLFAITSTVMTGCQPEEFDDSNGIDSPVLTPAFTVTPVAGEVNTYVLKADTENVLDVLWDRGDGTGPSLGKTIDTVFYPDAGSYTIELTAIARGGKRYSTTQEVVVATSDPVAGNLVRGGKMEAGDEDKWTKLAIGGNSVAFNFTNGKLVATGGSWGHSGVYQAIEVVAGRKYRLDLNVSGSGATDTWFEVYLGTQEPQQGSDYSSGGIRLGLNTWAGCGNSNFNGRLSTLACTGSLAGKPNIVEFTESGTIYLLIKSGGSNLGATGISIDNVELRGTN